MQLRKSRIFYKSSLGKFSPYCKAQGRFCRLLLTTLKSDDFLVDADVATRTTIAVDKKLAVIQTFDVVGREIFGAKFEPTTLKEFSLRAAFKLFFGKNSVVAKSLGSRIIGNVDLIYVRKQPSLTNFGRTAVQLNILPQHLQQQAGLLKRSYL